MLLEKGIDDVRAIILACFRIESDAPETLAFETGPAAVGPGSDHQSVKNPRVIISDRMISPKRPGQVLGIKPSAYNQHSALDVFHVARKITRLPVTVVRGVADLVPPEGVLALE